MEVLDTRDPAGVRVGAEIAPAGELVERLHELLVAVPVQVSGNILRPEMDDEALLGTVERAHDLPIERRVGRAQMCERLDRRGHATMLTTPTDNLASPCRINFKFAEQRSPDTPRAETESQTALRRFRQSRTRDQASS